LFFVIFIFIFNHEKTHFVLQTHWNYVRPMRRLMMINEISSYYEMKIKVTPLMLPGHLLLNNTCSPDSWGWGRRL